MNLAIEIETFLLARAEWVPVEEICERFKIDQRLLRATKNRRPLCHHFAISSSQSGKNGLKHLSLCSLLERLAYKHNRIKRLIAEKRALKDYEQALHNCLTGKRPSLLERHTGQLVLLP